MRNFLKVVQVEMNLHKAIITMIWAGCLIFTVQCAQGQEKRAHVNVREILEVMPEVKTARATLEDFKKIKEQELKKMGSEYQSKVFAFQTKEKTLSEANKDVVGKELQTLNTEIQDLGQRIREAEQKAEQELELKNNQHFSPIVTKLNTAIASVGKEKGFPYIYDISQQGVIYIGSGGTDLGPFVKEKLGIVEGKGKQ